VQIIPKMKRGAAWAVFSRAFASYVVHAPQSRRLLLLLANSLSSAELYFQVRHQIPFLHGSTWK
jgi:hypothetical protein